MTSRADGAGASLPSVVLGFLAAWTAFTLWAYDKPSRRTPALLLADLSVAVTTMLLTPYLQATDRVDATLPTFWVFGVVMAWAVPVAVKAASATATKPCVALLRIVPII